MPRKLFHYNGMRAKRPLKEWPRGGAKSLVRGSCARSSPSGSPAALHLGDAPLSRAGTGDRRSHDENTAQAAPPALEPRTGRNPIREASGLGCGRALRVEALDVAALGAG